MQELGRWQPIETAPKIGEPILAFRAGWGLPIWIAWGVTSYCGLVETRWYALDDWEDWARQGDPESGPTHWLPMEPFMAIHPKRTDR